VVYNAAENDKPYPEYSGINADIEIKEQTEYSESPPDRTGRYATFNYIIGITLVLSFFFCFYPWHEFIFQYQQFFL
jgi:hypothetical protein